MAIVYIVTAGFVIALLAAIPLLPFWKVWKILKTNHPDIWNAKGPFDLSEMIASWDLIGAFVETAAALEKDEAVKKKDPGLVQWCALMREVRGMAPKTFLGQIGYSLVFLYFTFFLTSIITSLFRH